VYLYMKYSFLRLLYKYCVNVEDQHSPETETVNIKFSLRFLGIIVRVLRLEVSVWISQYIGKRVWFSIRFSFFFFIVYSS
jgi:hypothetical protein